MFRLFEIYAATGVDQLSPTEYIKFLTSELELHRNFLSKSISELMTFFGVGFALLAAVAGFMGWKTLKDIRDSAKETFERETKIIFDQKASDLNARYEEISAEYDRSKIRIAALDSEYKEKLATLEEWILGVQTGALKHREQVSRHQESEARRSRGRILWVDNRLKNNKPIIAEFGRNDITVDTEESTDGAIKRLGKDIYDLIIVDMGHSIEQTESLRLLAKLREMKIGTERIIFSARWWVARYRKEAENLGAALVTANPGILVEEVMARLGRS